MAAIAIVGSGVDPQARAQDATGESASPAISLPRVTTAPVVRETIVGRQTVTGTLVAREEVRLSADIDGLRIIELAAEAGDRVERGQILAHFDASLIEAELAQNDAALARARAAIDQATSLVAEAQASRTEADAALERAQRLQRTGNTTQAVLDERLMEARTAASRLNSAQSGVLLAEAQLAELKAARDAILVRLARSELRSPVDGIVSARAARLGAVTSSAAGSLFDIIEGGRIELAGEAAESILPLIAPGQPASVRLIGESEPVAGRVRRIDPRIDETRRLGRVLIELETDEGLILGTFARAEIETARDDGLTLPLSAVQFGPSGPTVQKVGDNAVIATNPVVTGIQTGTRIEIESGLVEGDTVVAVSGTFLRDGDRIDPVPGLSN